MRRLSRTPVNRGGIILASAPTFAHQQVATKLCRAFRVFEKWIVRCVHGHIFCSARNSARLPSLMRCSRDTSARSVSARVPCSADLRLLQILRDPLVRRVRSTTRMVSRASARPRWPQFCHDASVLVRASLRRLRSRSIEQVAKWLPFSPRPIHTHESIETHPARSFSDFITQPVGIFQVLRLHWVSP